MLPCRLSRTAGQVDIVLKEIFAEVRKESEIVLSSSMTRL